MDEISKEKLDQICKILEVAIIKGDIKELLLDVCTAKELGAMYQRFKVAQMLKNGMTFNQIEEKTGISSTTIARVGKCLRKGKGYKKIFEQYNLFLHVGE